MGGGLIQQGESTGVQLLSSTRKRLSGLALRRPVLFGIVLTVVWSATMRLLAAGLSRFFSPEWFPDVLGSTLVNLGALLVLLAVVATFGWWRQAGLALPRPGRSWGGLRGGEATHWHDLAACFLACSGGVLQGPQPRRCIPLVALI